MKNKLETTIRLKDTNQMFSKFLNEAFHRFCPDVARRVTISECDVFIEDWVRKNFKGEK